ncbi:Sugar phosphate isomerase/epimerase [Paramicrobacterium humi]|uniref:Sugar phosphate isomerase/epimerase n=1 Tax=Paramicrobacterium humi TaxID=640635 RepID=A0A1H4KW66_9MICO|nr:sugar phosphate isomerase/epimerase [Microbacterium humi]SEB62747.1 Sugar phosphate isomerase/epimerase [Microbacterium humi]
MEAPKSLGCSTITFQHLPLAEALTEIAALGVEEIDLGALPGVCDHVPYTLDDAAIETVTTEIAASGLRVRSVNGDVGDLNATQFDGAARAEHLDRLLRLTAAIGAEALVLPAGALGHEPIDDEEADLDRIHRELSHAAAMARDHRVQLWVESLHFLRFGWGRGRADALHERFDSDGLDIGIVLDVAHVTAAGDDLNATIAAWRDRISHVHLRDAVVGDFSRRIGEGSVDFGSTFSALDDIGYSGGLILEQPSRAYEQDATAVADSKRREELRAVASQSLNRLREAMVASMQPTN